MTIAYNKETEEIALSKLSSIEYSALETLNLKWNRQMGALVGKASIDVLNAINAFQTLPPVLKARLDALTSELARYEKERSNAEPKEMYPYPIKATMFKHQIRGANLALMKFGWLGGGNGT